MSTRAPLHIMFPEEFQCFLKANDLRVLQGKFLMTPTNTKVGVVKMEIPTCLAILEHSYSQGDTRVTTWWPYPRPSYILVRENTVKIGPNLGPDEVICSACNREVLIRPVPVVDGHALCRSCFERTGLDFPGTIRPYVPAVLAWRDGEFVETLTAYCDIRSPDEIHALRNPETAPREVRQAFERKGLMARGGGLTRAGRDLLERIEAILQLRWRPDPPVGGIPPVFRPRSRAVARAGLQATHAGALYFLARRPGCAWGFLSEKFGSEVLMALLRRGLALGERRRGAPWYPSETGMTLLREIADE